MLDDVQAWAAEERKRVDVALEKIGRVAGHEVIGALRKASERILGNHAEHVME